MVGGKSGNIALEVDNWMRELLFGLMILVVSCSGDQFLVRDNTRLNYFDIGAYSLGIDKRFELMGSS
jgi:hypothetical protein